MDDFAIIAPRHLRAAMAPSPCRSAAAGASTWSRQQYGGFPTGQIRAPAPPGRGRPYRQRYRPQIEATTLETQ